MELDKFVINSEEPFVQVFFRIKGYHLVFLSKTDLNFWQQNKLMVQATDTFATDSCNGSSDKSHANHSDK